MIQENKLTSLVDLTIRPRRLRTSPGLRRMVRETHLAPDDFIYPLFVRHGNGRSPIPSMPGIDQLSVAEAVREAETAVSLGVPAVILFGIPALKDPIGLENFAEDGIVQQAIRAIKTAVPDLIVITDVCLCEYTDHGHCGLLTNTGEVDNDPTIERYGWAGVAQAEAGADVCAPSGMMDGQVMAIRDALDEEGHEAVSILAYAAKYASALYGPFRDAVDVLIADGGDRKAYQQDYRNGREALAILAGDALHTEAFRCLLDAPLDPAVLVAQARRLADAAGSRGCDRRSPPSPGSTPARP